MASTMTLLQLRTAARQRADMVGSLFVTDAELTSYVNQSAYELYDLLIQKYGDAYFAASDQITTDGVNETFAMPGDFYKLLGVDLKTSGAPNGWITCRPFMMSERNRNWRPNAAPVLGFTALRYRLLGDTLWLSPLPSSGQVLRRWYVPRWAELVNDSDVLDGISGWTEYVVVDAAIKCLQKEESDPSVLMAQKQALAGRIESAASNRDEGAPPTVSDVMGPDSVAGFGWPTSGGWGY